MLCAGKALARQLEEYPEVLSADTSLPKHGTTATAVVTTINKLVTGASIRKTNSVEVVKRAVALALAQTGVRTVVKVSKTTYANYRKGKISPTALTSITKCKSPGRLVELVWVLAGCGSRPLCPRTVNPTRVRARATVHRD